jgi:SAM-dependent methyltransferase
MADSDHELTPPPEVVAYYAEFPEEVRLELGPSRLEFERTKEILARVLPAPPVRIVDVGGAAGVYSLWLAAQGYEVQLVDASPRLIREARARSARSTIALASAAGVLVMGPLYHLPSTADRVTALREAFRVLARGGITVVAAISRYASTLDGLARKLSLDPGFVQIRDRDLADGQHRNDTDNADYFTTAYFHRPDDLRRILGVEGPAWILPDFDARWDDAALKKDLLDVARALESESSILGVSAHLLGIGRKP